MTPQNLPTVAWLMIKALTVLGFVIYTIFALVIVRQEHLMSNVLEEGFEPLLRILTYIHLAAAVFMIILALLVL